MTANVIHQPVSIFSTAIHSRANYLLQWQFNDIITD